MAKRVSLQRLSQLTGERGSQFASILCLHIYCKYSGFAPPCGTIMEPQPVKVIVNGKGKAVFLLPIMPKMTINMAKSNFKGSISRQTNSRIPIAVNEKTIPYQKFLTEKNAKNKAYCFILSNGLFEAFAEFCKTYRSSNPHKDCLEVLLSNF